MAESLPRKVTEPTTSRGRCEPGIPSPHALTLVLVRLANIGPMLLPCRVAHKRASTVLGISISRVIKGFQAMLSIPENLKVSSRL